MYERKGDKDVGSVHAASLFRDRNITNHYKMMQNGHRREENNNEFDSLLYAASCFTAGFQNSSGKVIYSIDNVKFGTIVIHCDKQCYIIDQYSKGAASILGFDDLDGKDLLHTLESLAPLHSCLKKLVDNAPDTIHPSVYFIRFPMHGSDSCLMLQGERLMPDSFSRFVITLYILNPNNPYIDYLQLKKEEIYYCNQDNKILPLSDLESHDAMCTLSSYGLSEKDPTDYSKGQYGGEPNLNQKRINEKALKELTRREREILMLVLEGNTNKFISIKLLISEGTVKKTISNAYKKLNVSSRIELAMLLLSD